MANAITFETNVITSRITSIVLIAESITSPPKAIALPTKPTAYVANGIALQGVRNYGLNKAYYVRYKPNYTVVNLNWRRKYCNRGGLAPCIVLRAQQRE